MRRKLIAGNWKMHGSLADIGTFVDGWGDASKVDADWLVCGPFPYLPELIKRLVPLGIAVGAQDCSAQASGAYTGEVSAQMLADIGVSHVILGHSERRAYHQESDALVLAKVKQALAFGLTPVVCVGETLVQREAGETDAVVVAQLEAIIHALTDAELQQLIFAYEPVWAIGTGLTATPEQAQAVHARLRASLAERSEALAVEMRILYGGSVKAENSAALFAMPDIDGGLVGGASLTAQDFLAIGHSME